MMNLAYRATVDFMAEAMRFNKEMKKEKKEKGRNESVTGQETTQE